MVWTGFTAHFCLNASRSIRQCGFDTVTPQEWETNVSEEILRFVDTIHRDRQVDKEVIFTGIEMALVSAAQKRFRSEEHTSEPSHTVISYAVFCLKKKKNKEKEKKKKKIIRPHIHNTLIP